MKLQNKKNKFIFFSLFFCAGLLTACKKFIEIPPPVDQAISSTVFSDDESATTAINGLYSLMMIQNFAFANSGMTLYPGLSADEFYSSSPNGDIDPFANNVINTNNPNVEVNLWKKGYNQIYQTNAILEGLSNSSNVSLEIKNQLTGEAKLVRALSYFYLVNLFGDVPYINSTNFQINSTIPRIGKTEIYSKIISDLQDAQDLMGIDYPSAGKVRPDKWAATTLLARVYLYQKNWQLAEENATEVINSGAFSLSDLNSIFEANSSEAIWQLLPVLKFLNTADGFTFIPFSPTVKPQYALTTWLIKAFENNDQRKKTWIDSTIVNGQTYFYPFKYKVRSGSTLTEYNMVFRLAELYLIRAEARAEQNDITGAQEDLNIIRTRAGLQNTTANTQSSLLLAIQHERQIEFFAEWGHRWFDLKRTGDIDMVLGAEKPGWKPADALYPIPLSQLQANTNLIQNPGY
jgi:starch-binding outer membrane protein, SusD/RagB family